MTKRLQLGDFLGQVVKSVSCADAQLTLVRHDETRLLEAHTHQAPYFCVLLHGAYREQYEGNWLEYEPFSLALHPANYLHRDEVSAPGSVFFMIELGEAWHVKLAYLIDLRAVRVELRGTDLVWLAMRVFREFSEFSGESELHIESLLLELVARAARLPVSMESTETWFSRAIAFIDENYADAISMQRIADVAGVHPVTLARAFRSTLQQTASEYINRLRVRRACDYLLGSAHPLATVAGECGFIDQSYFTKVFRGVTGMTPVAFRKAVQGSVQVIERA